MSKISLHVAAAMLCWLSLAGAVPPKAAPTQAKVATEIHKATQPSTIQRTWPPDSCYSQISYVEADLCAQWRAMLATERAASEARTASFISGLAAFLSFVGTCLLVWTFYETRRATRSQLRPYVGFEGISFGEREGANGLVGIFGQIRNYGTTPAFQFEFKCNWSVAPAPFNWDFPELPAEVATELAPGQIADFGIAVENLTKYHVKLIESSQAALLFRVTFKFRDTFGRIVISHSKHICIGHHISTMTFRQATEKETQAGG